MASSRDDFIIAIRSAFLKKSNKQKFSLLTLVFLSILIIILSSFELKLVRQTKTIINEIVYRSSLIVSYPENFILKSINEIIDYSSFYEEYKKSVIEIENLKSEKISNKIVRSENEELKELIEDYSSSSDKILAKVMFDHNSPFLKSLIINKGSKDNIKIGTNIYDKSYLVGKVVEINYKSSRVLLISDLNSNIPVSIAPSNIQAIVSGNGKNSGEIKYVKGNYLDDIEDKSIAYTSGTGSMYKSGIPVGKVEILENQGLRTLKVNFYSNFSQLKYVFAEVYSESNEIIDEKNEENTETDNQKKELKVTDKLKLDLLNEQIEIYTNTNLKLLNENKELEKNINDLNIELVNLLNTIGSQKKTINQNKIDNTELEFLKLNLIYSKKCSKSLVNLKGFKFGTKKYRECVINKGKL
jgi:rod shape-determining protein MreC